MCGSSECISCFLRNVRLLLNIFLNYEMLLQSIFCIFKDTHREKAPSNKTPALRNSTNMGVLVLGTLNQLFIRGS